MMSAILLSALTMLAGAALVFYVVDRIVKVGTKGTDAEISLGAIFAAGFILTVLVAALTITVFTGALSLLGRVLAGLAIILGAVYAWRVAAAARDKRLMKEMLALEEAQVRAAAGADSRNAAAWLRLSELCERKGDHASAIQYFRKVCELEPTDAHQRRLAAMKAEAVTQLRQDA